MTSEQNWKKEAHQIAAEMTREKKAQTCLFEALAIIERLEKENQEMKHFKKSVELTLDLCERISDQKALREMLK